MATTSEVNVGIDEISSSISANRRKFENAKNNIIAASSALGGLPAQYSDVRTTVQGYGDTDDYEMFKKAELAKLEAEFTALKSDIDAAITALGI